MSDREVSEEVLDADAIEGALSAWLNYHSIDAKVNRADYDLAAEAMRHHRIRIEDGSDAPSARDLIDASNLDSEALRAQVAALTEDLQIANERGDAWRDELRSTDDALAQERHATGALRRRAEAAEARIRVVGETNRELTDALGAMLEASEEWERTGLGEAQDRARAVLSHQEPARCPTCLWQWKDNPPMPCPDPWHAVGETQENARNE